MGKSKKIGTEAESAVVKVLLPTWPSAERRALSGAVDLGDITGTPGITWQVKGGHMAEGASDSLVAEWMKDLEKQRVANRDPVGVLVWKRYAVGPANAHRWWAAMPSWQLARLVTADYCARPASACVTALEGVVVCRMTLEEAITLLRHGGYGSG